MGSVTLGLWLSVADSAPSQIGTVTVPLKFNIKYEPTEGGAQRATATVEIERNDLGTLLREALESEFKWPGICG